MGGHQAQVSAMRLDDRFADHEAHAKPFGLGGDVGLEDSIRHFRRGAWSAVDHLHGYRGAHLGGNDDFDESVSDRRMFRLAESISRTEIAERPNRRAGFNPPACRARGPHAWRIPAAFRAAGSATEVPRAVVHADV